MGKAIAILGWACLLAWLVVLGWWAHEASQATQTQREAFLRERWELAEKKAETCERLREAEAEMTERTVSAWRDMMAALGLEE